VIWSALGQTPRFGLERPWVSTEGDLYFILDDVEEWNAWVEF
jgi:hypothetical protein